jgi:hypothetical protein
LRRSIERHDDYWCITSVNIYLRTTAQRAAAHPTPASTVRIASRVLHKSNICSAAASFAVSTSEPRMRAAVRWPLSLLLRGIAVARASGMKGASEERERTEELGVDEDGTVKLCGSRQKRPSQPRLRGIRSDRQRHQCKQERGHEVHATTRLRPLTPDTGERKVTH